MGSRETLILRLIIWVVNKYFSEKYRMMSPSDLNQVVDNYLAQLPELGIRLEYSTPPKGIRNDEVTTDDQNIHKDA